MNILAHDRQRGTGTLADEALEYQGSPGDEAGWDVSGAQDADGDGHDEALVAGYGVGAWVIPGVDEPAGGQISDNGAANVGEGGSAYIDAVAGAGDVDGDGLGDILVGSFAFDDDGAGAAGLILGRTGI